MRAIVFGADGSIGKALVQALARADRVVYSTTRRPATVSGKRLFVDLAASNLDTIPLPKVDIAYFCAATVSYAQCRADPDMARQVNLTSPVSLARRLVAAGARVVLLSTSAVFDGRLPCVPAERPTCPVTLYGELAAEAERQFSALGEKSSVVRLTKLITPDAKRFIDWIGELSSGNQIVAFSDLRMAPISLEDVLSALLAIGDRPVSGIFQISGSKDISYYDAARHLALRLGVDPALVVERRAIDAGVPIEEIPKFSSLDAMRFFELTGRKAPEPEAVIESVFQNQFDAKRNFAGMIR